MKKIIYSKCATERKKEYRIITTIFQQDEERLVCKKALGEESKVHVQHMYEVYAKNLFQNDLVQLTPCEKYEDGSVVFEYIYGDTFSAQFEAVVQKENWGRFVELMAELKEIIWSVEDKKPFSRSKGFEEYFGVVEGLDAYEAAENLNIDLLPENIIISDGNRFVIDYEWVFPFAVPIKYIMFRALFFSPFLGKLPVEVREEVLKLAEISEAEWKLFLQMEVSFQNHVSDSSLDELYKKMPQNVFATHNQDIQMLPLNVVVARDLSGRELYHAFSNELQKMISFTTKEAGVVKIELTKNASIIKLNLNINGEQCVEFKTNSMLQIINDYYFAEGAMIEVDTPADARVDVEYTVISNPKSELARLADALKSNNELRLKNMSLEEWNHAYEAKMAELESEIQALNDRIQVIESEKHALNGELTLIKNSKVWRAYSKIRGLN